MKFNYYGFKAIYFHEMNRFYRTVGQSLLSPVISTSLYFVVFGSVIGGYIEKIDGVSYGSYIVPGLLMLTSINLVRYMNHNLHHRFFVYNHQ